MKKTLFILAAVLMLTSSCSKEFYQVYDVAAPSLKDEGKVMQYENEDCKVNYNLWASEGNLSFLIENKKDIDMFIVMPQSFFILNGVANDYYQEATHGTSKTKITSSSAMRSASVFGFVSNGFNWFPGSITRQGTVGFSLSTTETYTTREKDIIVIPAHSSKYIQGFNISDYVYMDCDNQKFNFPKKVSEAITYTESNSPLKFRNRIAYTFDKKATDFHYIDNSFYLRSFKNFSGAAAKDKVKTVDCVTRAVEKKAMFNMTAPFRFYNKYNKK